MAVKVERAIECRSRVEQLWKVVGDTDRLNRAVGNLPVSFTRLDGAGAARFLGKTRLGGFSVEYEDLPSEWVEPRWLRLTRRMRTGPARLLVIEYEFEPRGEGSQLLIRLTLEPRYGILTPILRRSMRLSLGDLAKAVHLMDEAVVTGQPYPPIPATNPINLRALERAAASLRAAGGSELGDRLVKHVREGEDIDLARIRPFELADDWAVDRISLLEAMLHGVRAGLLDLRWEAVCPSCQQATSSVPSLAEIAEHGTCHLCDIAFRVDIDEALEATFRPTLGVRDSDGERPYCIGGPCRVPHVLSQAILPSRGVALLEAPDAEGSYRLFVRGGLSAQVEVKGEHPDAARIEFGKPGDGRRIDVRPRASITVSSTFDDERHVKLERLIYGSKAATARTVTAMPAFRRDFSSDTLRPGTSLQISKVTLLFSDLTASTQLYSTVGDAAAFRLVQEHFEVVIGLIEANKGALVKTIGDAVMAVFVRELDAVAASRAILEAFEPFRSGHPHRKMTHIKLGLYSGPCYAVTANNLLDYFGQTVNIAARLQAQAESGEIVLEASLCDHAIGAGTLPASWVASRYDAHLKGVAGTVPVVRVRQPAV
jgi:adenylate cyclase